MQECISRISEYAAEGKDLFFKDRKTQDAVLRNLQILAESTQRLTDSTKSRASDIEWRAIAAFRNVAVHDYLGIDLQQIWNIIEMDLPKLRQGIDKLLKDLEEK
jgi:uncharacterized protein with HEPN domain